jgi:ribonucleotide monophosphatase NagD (HAD superfamily)
MTYANIRRATRHIEQGAQFIGTNPDGAFPTPDGPAPGAGAIVYAVETAAEVSPTIVGKPEPLMFEVALEGTSIDQDGVVIGDNPATDILGAHRAGLTGILVADEAPVAASARDFTHPDVVIQSLADLFSHTVTPWADPSTLGQRTFDLVLVRSSRTGQVRYCC